MTEADFARALKASVVDENTALYRNLFNATPISTATDPYFQRALEFFSQLDAEQRQAFFDIVRQVSVDTVSNVLGVIDGVCPIAGAEDISFTLSRSPGGPFVGLQDTFLAEIENTSA